MPPWDQATRLLDERWFIDVDRDVARGRVIQRHLIAGIARDQEEAEKRFDENDWPNGVYLFENSDVASADKIVRCAHDGSISTDSRCTRQELRVHESMENLVSGIIN